jgi:hypothetical protein
MRRTDLGSETSAPPSLAAGLREAVYMEVVDAESLGALVSAVKRHAESGGGGNTASGGDAAARLSAEREIGYAIYLFDRLWAAEASLRESGALEGRTDLADLLDQAWERWLAPCHRAEASLQHFERSAPLESTGGFRERCARARERVKKSANPGSWRAAVQDPKGELFGRPAVTKEDLRQKTGPFPE